MTWFHILQLSLSLFTVRAFHLTHCRNEQWKLYVKENPWLTGRLSKDQQGTKLSWFKLPLDPYSYITKGKLDCSVADLSAIAAPYKHFVKAVGTGSECIGNDKPLFNVTLLELNDCVFALIVSLCHTIADGCT
jgi:hypothetical protein